MSKLDAAIERSRKLLELRSTRLKLRALKAMEQRGRGGRRLRESYDVGPWLSLYGDVIDRGNTFERDLVFPISTANDRRYGQNWPFWRTWQEHARIRAASRLVWGKSPLARGVLNALVSYIVGEGMTAKVSPSNRQLNPKIALAVQQVLDRFTDDNDWLTFQAELALRGRRDGEFFLRLFPADDGRLRVRPVEPEHVVEPPDMQIDESSFGVYTDPDDLLDVRGFWVAYDGMASNGEYVSGSEMLHVKENVDSTVKRGQPDFAFDTLDLISTAQKLIENVGAGAAIQAAIAFVRQHQAADTSAIADFVEGAADYSQQRPFTSNTENVRRYEPGTVVDIDSGQEFVATPFGSNVGGHVEAVQALLRAVAVHWNAPEWITSADSSNNNFASSLVAESPFVKHIKRLQRKYSAAFRRVYLAVLENHCRRRGGVRVDSRVFTYRELMQLLEVSVVAPTPETRDRQQEASLNQTYITLGVKDRQTAAQELGLDWAQVEANNEEFEKKHGEQGVPKEMRAGEGGGGPDDSNAGGQAEGAGGDGGPGGGKPADMAAMLAAAGLTEVRQPAGLSESDEVVRLIAGVLG